jgi:hypothetical protein
MTATEATPAGVSRPEPDGRARHRSSRRPSPVWWLGAVAAAWVVSYLAYLVHAAAVLPLAILFATASLLRGGRSLLDRVMLAFALLFGLTGAAGLLLSYWPFGLHPVAVAGTAFTGLGVVFALTGRRPNLPRPRLGDLITVGAGLFVAAVLAWPLIRDGQVRVLATSTKAEDIARHANLFEGIQIVQGYLYLHQDAAATHVFEGMLRYPQGSHLLAAILDSFVRSSTEPLHGMALFNHHWAYVIGGYAVFVMVAIWAAQWLGAAALTLGRQFAVASFILAMALATDVMAALPTGHSAETAGLTLMLLLVALLARPTQRTGQQIVLVGSLIVAIGFTYYLFLPIAGILGALWLVLRRRQLLRRPVVLAVTGAATALLAPAPAAIGLLQANQSEGLGAAGGLAPNSGTLLALLAVVFAAYVSSRAWQVPIWRMYALALGAVGVLNVALFAVYTVRHPNRPATSGYYASKSLFLLQILLVVGCVLVARVLARPDPRQRRHPIENGWPSLLTGSAVALACVAASGLVTTYSPTASQYGGVYARIWFRSGDDRDPWARDILNVSNSDPALRGVPTYILDEQPYVGYALTLFLSAYDGTSAQTQHGLYGNAFNPKAQAEGLIRGTTGRVRLVARTDAMLPLADELRAQFPDREIVVLRKTWS